MTRNLVLSVLLVTMPLAVREVHIMDAAERVAEYGVFSTPFIVMDGTLEFVGVPRESDLRAQIAARVGG